jgi:hypothetical protein
MAWHRRAAPARRFQILDRRQTPLDLGADAVLLGEVWQGNRRRRNDCMINLRHAPRDPRRLGANVAATQQYV